MSETAAQWQQRKPQLFGIKTVSGSFCCCTMYSVNLLIWGDADGSTLLYSIQRWSSWATNKYRWQSWIKCNSAVSRAGSLWATSTCALSDTIRDIARLWNRSLLSSRSNHREDVRQAASQSGIRLPLIWPQTGCFAHLTAANGKHCWLMDHRPVTWIEVDLLRVQSIWTWDKLPKECHNKCLNFVDS